MSKTWKNTTGKKCPVCDIHCSWLKDAFRNDQYFHISCSLLHWTHHFSCDLFSSLEWRSPKSNESQTNCAIITFFFSIALTTDLKKSACEKSQSYSKTSWSWIGLVVYSSHSNYHQIVDNMSKTLSSSNGSIIYA